MFDWVDFAQPRAVKQTINSKLHFNSGILRFLDSFDTSTVLVPL